MLLVRYTKTQVKEEDSSSMAVLMQELAVKLPVSFLLFAIECRGPCKMVAAIRSDLLNHRKDWIKMWVPAIAYTMQMTLLNVGYENVEAAIGQVTYQTPRFCSLLSSPCSS